MRRFPGTFMIGCLLLALGIFFGVALASQGVERVNGPTKPITKAAVEPTQSASSVKTASASVKASVSISSDSFINRVGNKTGDILQIMAYHSVRSFVSFFDELFK